MLANWANEIIWQFVTFVNVTANLTLPTPQLFGCIFSLWLWFRLDVLLVIVVGQRRFVGKHLSILNLGDKHGVRAEIDGFHHMASDESIAVFRNVNHIVHCALFFLTVLKFVDIPAGLELKCSNTDMGVSVVRQEMLNTHESLIRSWV